MRLAVSFIAKLSDPPSCVAGSSVLSAFSLSPCLSWTVRSSATPGIAVLCMLRTRPSHSVHKAHVHCPCLHGTLESLASAFLMPSGLHALGVPAKIPTINSKGRCFPRDNSYDVLRKTVSHFKIFRTMK